MGMQHSLSAVSFLAIASVSYCSASLFLHLPAGANVQPTKGWLDSRALAWASCSTWKLNQPQRRNLCHHVVRAQHLRTQPTQGPILKLRMSEASNNDIPPALLREDIITQDIVQKAKEVQAWLEPIYDSLDYEAALVRAGAIVDGEDVDDQEEEDFELEDEEIDEQPVDTMSEEAELCEGGEGELTYGEMDMRFFLALMKEIEPDTPANLVDIGSGRGQLILAAAREGRWQRCTGIEIERTVLEIGRGALELVRAENGQDFGAGRCELREGDMYVEQEAFTDADVVFAYATCFATSDGMTLKRLSASLAASLKGGCQLITVNKMLDTTCGFELQGVFEGPNPDSITDPARAYLWLFQP